MYRAGLSVFTTPVVDVNLRNRLCKSHITLMVNTYVNEFYQNIVLALSLLKFKGRNRSGP